MRRRPCRRRWTGTPSGRQPNLADKTTLALSLAFCIAVIATGCATKAGQAVANRIEDAKSPVVRAVFFHDDYLDGPEVVVYLRPGTTESEADRLWCEVVVPAGGSDTGVTAVTVWDDTGSVWMARGVACPTSS
jgi:hypothetical protein